MNIFFKKIIIVLIAGSLAGGSLFYFWKSKNAPSENQTVAVAEEDLSKKDETKDLQNTEDNKRISDGRAEIVNYVEKNISKISPEKPAIGLTWRAIKIWFIDNKDFYVDYKDEVSNTRRVLISQSVAGPTAEYEVLGFFIPGENGWMLKSGKDISGTVSLVLYEKSDEAGEWAAK